MARRITRRAIPTVTRLEPRRLLALTANWIGQDGQDHAGLARLATPQPNDYQDIHIRLSGFTGDSRSVSHIYLGRNGGGETWDYDANGGGSNAYFAADPNDPTHSSGDLFVEPQQADPNGTYFDTLTVQYANHAADTDNLLHNTGSAVQPNLRVANRGLAAQWLGQDGQDWTGSGPAVGPDNIQDFHLKLSNLSQGATESGSVLTATPSGAPALNWQIGLNPQGYWNAELRNQVTSGGTDSADYFGNPGPALSNAPLSLTVTYSDANRAGKTDTVALTAGSVNAALTMPFVAVPDLPITTAHWGGQDSASPANANVILDALPSQAVQSAVLSDEAGTVWKYGAPPGTLNFPDSTGLQVSQVGRRESPSPDPAFYTNYSTMGKLGDLGDHRPSRTCNPLESGIFP